MCSTEKKKKARPEWYAAVKKYSKPDVKSSIWQIVNSVGPYLGLWALMAYFVRHDQLWTAAAIAPLPGILVVRMFIIFHDCGHYSFFKTKTANKIAGYFTGVLTFSPFHDWGKDHKLHHATSGNLDKRGFGDIWTLTVDEYKAADTKTKFKYRLYRNPLIIFFIGPILVFVVKQRFVRKHTGKNGAMSVYLTNVGLAIYSVLMVWALGWYGDAWWQFLMLQLIVIAVGAIAGVWMFYVQHQFEETYWAYTEKWTLVESALEGSSYYKLPQPLQWLTGNIGFHHIHHLSAKIPNYKLEAAYNDSEIFQAVEPLTIRKSLQLFNFRLWDLKNQRMVGYKALED